LVYEYRCRGRDFVERTRPYGRIASDLLVTLLTPLDRNLKQQFEMAACPRNQQKQRLSAKILRRFLLQGYRGATVDALYEWIYDSKRC